MDPESDSLQPQEGQPADSGTSTTSADPSGLKRKGVTSDAYARRKRATTACQFCRLRKTKCDNARPVCGFCQYHNAKCVYGDSDPFEGQEVQSVGGRADTVQQRDIIDRLDEIRDMLLHSTNRNEEPDNSNSAYSGSERVQWPSKPAASPSTVPLNLDWPSTASGGASRNLASTRCEMLLRWPIFNNIVGDEDRKLESFALGEETGPENDWSQQSHHQPNVIVEHAFVPLCHKFLHNVHSRNPILDGEDLISYAKHVTENGLAWDSPSCLVVSLQANNPLLCCIR